MFAAGLYRRTSIVVRMLLAVCAVFVCGASPIVVSASGVLVDSNGFNIPPYAASALQGQQGWNSAGSGPASTATVSATIGMGGGDGVQVNRVAGSDYYWGVAVANSPTQRFIYVDWDMKVNQSSTTGIGPFLGVQAYDYVGSQLYVDYGVLGAIGVYPATGKVIFQAQNTGSLMESAFTATSGQWYHYRLLFDFQAHQYYAYFNGNLVVGTGFVDGTGLNNFTDADLAAIAADADLASQNATGTAYFDNYRIVEQLPGDYNLDGLVNSADYSSWKTTFGNAVTPSGTAADGNGNGLVDAADYTIWRDHSSTGSGAGAGQAVVGTAIPEPRGTLLICLAALGMTAVRQFREFAWRKKSE